MRHKLILLNKEKKKAQRQARNLKVKAAKCDLGELLQILMMKAFVLGEEIKSKASGSEGASSSSEPWMPKDPKEAFDKIQELVSQTEQAEVTKFAATLRASADE